MSKSDAHLSVLEEKIKKEYYYILYYTPKIETEKIYLRTIILEKYGLVKQKESLDFYSANLPCDLTWKEVDKALISDTTFDRFYNGVGNMEEDILLKICKGFFCNFDMCVKLFSANGHRYTSESAKDVKWRKILYDIGKENEAFVKKNGL